MAKTHKNLYNQCFSLESLYNAFLKARKGKRQKRAVFEFEENLGANLQQLLDELNSGTYQSADYTQFVVKEPKPRIIYAPAFRDTIVQHAIYAVIYPIFDKSFIFDNYGCRKGKGTLRAANKAQQCLRQSDDNNYLLQLDISKFFYSIDRTILMQLIKKKIADQRLLSIIQLFLKYPHTVGIPIGNLLSQLFALIYLNEVDHYSQLLRAEARSLIFSKGILSPTLNHE
jgi:RNA-directed DNA polymerase